jgi:hypothetical protein
LHQQRELTFGELAVVAPTEPEPPTEQ